MLKTFWNNFVRYLQSLDTFTYWVTIILFVFGIATALAFIVGGFGIFNLAVSILDFGIVYYGYTQYAKRLP